MNICNKEILLQKLIDNLDLPDSDDQAEGVAEDGGQKSRGGRDEKAVPAVTSRPTVIHWYTWRMKTDATLILVDRVESRKLSIE